MISVRKLVTYLTGRDWHWAPGELPKLHQNLKSYRFPKLIMDYGCMLTLILIDV